MQSFTVHLPEGRRPTLAEAEKAVFVAEGFSFPAFVFGGFWLAYKRLWLALAVFLIGLAVLTGLGIALHLHPLAASALSFLLNLYLGIEGNDILRRTLERGGMPAAGIVTGRKQDDAEAAFFARLPLEAAAAPARTGVLPVWRGGNEVLGMFPQPGGRS
jgi:hypothetical protein